LKNDTHTEGLWTALQLKPESWPRHLSAFYSFLRSERCENISFAQIISTFSAPKKEGGYGGLSHKRDNSNMKISLEEFLACRVKGFQKAMLLGLGFGIGFTLSVLRGS